MDENEDSHRGGSGLSPDQRAAHRRDDSYTMKVVAKRLALCALIALVPVLAGASAQDMALPAEKPNIVFMMTDDSNIYTYERFGQLCLVLRPDVPQRRFALRAVFRKYLLA